MARDTNTLIKEQIVKSYGEIIFVKAIFSLINCASLFFIGFIFERMYTNNGTNDEDYLKLLEVTAALLAPYITIIAQGYNYPRSRKINTLRYLLFKQTLQEEDLKTIYDN